MRYNNDNELLEIIFMGKLEFVKENISLLSDESHLILDGVLNELICEIGENSEVLEEDDFLFEEDNDEGLKFEELALIIDCLEIEELAKLSQFIESKFQYECEKNKLIKNNK